MPLHFKTSKLTCILGHLITVKFARKSSDFPDLREGVQLGGVHDSVAKGASQQQNWAVSHLSLLTFSFSPWQPKGKGEAKVWAIMRGSTEAHAGPSHPAPSLAEAERRHRHQQQHQANAGNATQAGTAIGAS